MLEIGDEIVAELRAHPAADRVEIAGSARRMTDTCKDLDVIATATDAEALVEAFKSLAIVAQVKGSGEAGAKAATHNGLHVDFRVVAPNQFGNVLQHLTGSKQHNVALREYAVKKGLHVSEWGIEDDNNGKTYTCATEQQVYKRLGLAYIEPELREGRGELEAALEGELPELLTDEDIKGDLHSHTTLSDGRNTLGEMAKAAQARGYKYLAITDHSASFGFGNDVQPDALKRRIAEIEKFNAKTKGFRLLAGSEVNIQPDGTLDYADDVLAQLDWVVASVHSSFRMNEKRMTERMMAAMDNPHVHAIGHPTGRILLKREPYAAGHRADRRARGRDRHDARDQRQPQPARPLGRARAPGRRGRRDDRDQLRCPRHRDARPDALRRRDRAPSLARTASRSPTPAPGRS